MPKLPTHDIRDRGVEDRNILTIADPTLVHDAVIFGRSGSFSDVLSWRIIRDIFCLKDRQGERFVQDMPVVAF
jgi:hypothetical protein